MYGPCLDPYLNKPTVKCYLQTNKENLKEIVYPWYLGNIVNYGRCDDDTVVKLKSSIFVKWYRTCFKTSK